MYETELQALANAGAKFLVVGAVAMGLHGSPRATLDLDLLPELANDNLATLWNTLQRLQYRPRIPVTLDDAKNPATREQWVRDKNLIGLAFWNPVMPGREIDLILHSPVTYEQAESASRTLPILGVPVRVASIDTLIAMKRFANRDKDRADITALERLRK